MSHLSEEVRTALLAIYAVLAASTLLAWAMAKCFPKRDFSELLARIRTWWIIIGLFSAALAWSLTAMIWFMGFVSYLSLKEFLSMTPTRRADRRVLFYAYLAVIVQYYLATAESYGLFIMFIPVIMFIWIPTRMWMIGKTEGFLRAAGTLHWGLMITVFSLSHAAYLLVMQPSASPRVLPQYPLESKPEFIGPGLLLFLVLMTEANDIFQYLWGKTLGRRKVAPTVSPGKTYAGLIGGVLSTIVLAGLIGPRLTLLDLPRSLLSGLLISVAGFAGDLCFSALKRDLGIKDFGATLPGHGGVLDRVDSLVFTAPLFFHFTYYCYGI